MMSLRKLKFVPGIRALAVFVLSALTVVHPALAMRVSPMVSELSTTGSGAVARIEVGNITNKALPFETRVTRIDFDAKGNLVETPADDDFVVFPPQGVVPVSGRQVVRVQWIGKPDIPTSQAYYVWIRQLPVETEPEKIEGSQSSVSINVLYTMKSLVVIAPAGAKPQVEVKSLVPAKFTPQEPRIDPSLKGDETAQPAAAAQPGLQVTLFNSGNRYALMSGAKWIVSATDINGQPFERTYDNEEVAQTVGIGYLAPAGGERSFMIPTGVELDPAKRISLRFAR